MDELRRFQPLTSEIEDFTCSLESQIIVFEFLSEVRAALL